MGCLKSVQVDSVTGKVMTVVDGGITKAQITARHCDQCISTLWNAHESPDVIKVVFKDIQGGGGDCTAAANINGHEFFVARKHSDLDADCTSNDCCKWQVIGDGWDMTLTISNASSYLWMDVSCVGAIWHDVFEDSSSACQTNYTSEIVDADPSEYYGGTAIISWGAGIDITAFWAQAGGYPALDICT